MSCLARAFLCENSINIGDSCGECRSCKTKNIYDQYYVSEWTGAGLNNHWNWWDDDGKYLIGHEEHSILIDEFQDLDENHQKSLFRDVEKTKCLFIIATTHENKINDALLSRFAANKFLVRRPSVEQAVQCMKSYCLQVGLTASDEQLGRVSRHYGQNLRRCVEFVFMAQEQACNSIVTEDFLELIIGSDPVSTTPPQRTRLRL